MDDADRDREIERLRKKCHALSGAITKRVDWDTYDRAVAELRREIQELARRTERHDEFIASNKSLKTAAATALITAVVGIIVALWRGN